MSISTVAPVANSGAAALTDAGIGSGLNVDAIVSQLMTVESEPLTQLQGQISSYNATLSAYGIITSSLSAFQTAVQALNTPSAFSADSVTPGNSSVLSGPATTSAVNGNYTVNVTQLAQAQSLTAAGQASTSTAIGGGTISFQFGTISAAPTIVGTALDPSVATNGIAAGSLSINGTTITT
ncbi:MAG TPA: flagellar cap protein FliD N-terminal domain-containing protein, partial [Burkholderiaceae bacterium]|nr:flagellar cap protein FliD N-terminal domain-containing protein [Burkholderiaceae bacterium]